MATPVKYRDVSFLISLFRRVLLGRKFNQSLRHKDELATRSPPLPILPEGPSDKLAHNYYYTRDGRRESRPSEVFYTGDRIPALPSSESAGSKIEKKRVYPGVPYEWKKSPDSL